MAPSTSVNISSKAIRECDVRKSNVFKCRKQDVGGIALAPHSVSTFSEDSGLSAKPVFFKGVLLIICVNHIKDAFAKNCLGLFFYVSEAEISVLTIGGLKQLHE